MIEPLTGGLDLISAEFFLQEGFGKYHIGYFLLIQNVKFALSGLNGNSNSQIRLFQNIGNQIDSGSLLPYTLRLIPLCDSQGERKDLING